MERSINQQRVDLAAMEHLAQLTSPTWRMSMDHVQRNIDLCVRLVRVAQPEVATEAEALIPLLRKVRNAQAAYVRFCAEHGH